MYERRRFPVKMIYKRQYIWQKDRWLNLVVEPSRVKCPPPFPPGMIVIVVQTELKTISGIVVTCDC